MNHSAIAFVLIMTFSAGTRATKYTENSENMFTNQFSGETLGLVKEHQSLTLNEALLRFDNPRIDDYRYSVHVFRGVIDPIALSNWEQTTRPLDQFAFDQSVTAVSERLLYYNVMTRVKQSAVDEQRETTAQIQAEQNNECGNRGAVEMENYFRRMTVSGTTARYYYNCEFAPPGFHSCLDTIKSNLHPSRNPDVGRMAGINEPMFYVAGADSVTAMHSEDGSSDSANLLHAGENKLWIIVEKNEYLKLHKEVAKELKKQKVPNVCNLPLHHKDIFVTPFFLDSHKIRYEFITQRAGDLLYIRYGVLHQVVNMGLNVAEAINFGSAEWNIANPLHTFCGCREACVQQIQENCSVRHVVRTGKIKATHVCDIPLCEKKFATKALLRAHQQRIHSFRHECNVCGKTYAQDKGLSRHMRQSHRDRSEDQRTCSRCRKSVVDLRRHIRDIHERIVNCSTCNIAFSRDDLQQQCVSRNLPVIGVTGIFHLVRRWEITG